MAQLRSLRLDLRFRTHRLHQTVHLADTTQSSAPWGPDRIDQSALPLSGTYTYPDTAGSGVTAYVIDTTASDGNGRGTHVATTIAGSTAGVIAGIDRVTNNHSGPSVANLSLHGGASSTLDTAVRNSIASGVTYAVAAGNSSANASSYSPARVTEAITVGATTSTDARAGYSHYGSVPDVFAPGSSTHVAGAAAVCFAGHTSATPAQVATARVSGATSNVVTSPGTGSPDKFLKIVP
ncbi:hypothetical protein M2158_001597 [Streptomyces sp. SAI-144]|jgi:hypothetical protein|nr:hypothetical protein [Streptomyces sp. SAI-144]